MSTATQSKPSDRMHGLLIERIQDAHGVPVSPAIALRLIELGKNPEASPDDYASLISSSPALAAKLMATVNSSWFGVRHRITTPTHAVNLLGTANVRCLAITQCVASLHANVDLDRELLDSYWRAALVKATAGRLYVEQTDEQSGDEVFLVGILEDVALPLMHVVAPEVHQRLLGDPPAPVQELLKQQRASMQEDHASAGALILAGFDLPEPIVNQVRSHHDAPMPEAAGSASATVDAVRFSSFFPHRHSSWAPDDARQAREFLAGASDVPFESLEQFTELLQQKHAETVRLLGVDPEVTVDLPRLLREATAEIADTTASMVGQLHQMVANAVQSDVDLSSLTVQAAGLEERATRDELTRLLNRAGLDDAAGKLVADCAAQGGSLAVAFFDVDDFKQINDADGHQTGDEVLKAVGASLGRMGVSVTAGRYGGDEFVVCLPGVARDTARDQVDAVRRDLAAGVSLSDGRQMPVSFSIGLLWKRRISPEATWEELLAEADVAMYRSKRSAKGALTLAGDLQ